MPFHAALVLISTSSRPRSLHLPHLPASSCTPCISPCIPLYLPVSPCSSSRGVFAKASDTSRPTCLGCGKTRLGKPGRERSAPRRPSQPHLSTRALMICPCLRGQLGPPRRHTRAHWSLLQSWRCALRRGTNAWHRLGARTQTSRALSRYQGCTRCWTRHNLLGTRPKLSRRSQPQHPDGHRQPLRLYARLFRRWQSPLSPVASTTRARSRPLLAHDTTSGIRP